MKDGISAAQNHRRLMVSEVGVAGVKHVPFILSTLIFTLLFLQLSKHTSFPTVLAASTNRDKRVYGTHTHQKIV